MGLTRTQIGEAMRLGREAKQKAIADEKALKEKTIADQEAELVSLKAQLSQKNVAQTAEFTKTGLANPEAQTELDKLRQEVADMQKVLFAYGAMPKKQSSQPWKSIKKPFHKDIFKTKEQHKGFELGFISESELDDYTANGYTVVKGEDYGEKAGVLKRKRMIGVERSIEDSEADRTLLREFNLAQRTSALQKVKDLSKGISNVPGCSAEGQLGYEVRR